MAEPVVLYEERQSLAIITINRPEKMNTLNDAVIQGIADAIDDATASPEVSSIIIRGADAARGKVTTDSDIVVPVIAIGTGKLCLFDCIT